MSDARSIASPTFHVVTAPVPGAIGIIQLHGRREQLDRILDALVGSPVPNTARHVHFAEIDEGVVVAVNEQTCHLMPHGGVRVIQRLAGRLRELGVHEGAVTVGERDPAAAPAPCLFPEAATPLEADMLLCLARAASPAAVDLLMDQPRRWRAAVEGGVQRLPRNLEGSRGLDQLVKPPTVALVGAANVGKSTLSNQILGRSVSLTADLPGTTRDWVGSLAQVLTPVGLVAVSWIDTPGYRVAASASERAAWELALPQMTEADLVVLVGDCAQGWWDPIVLDRRPQIGVLNKCDLRTPQEVETLRRQSPVQPVVAVSARTGAGLDCLGTAIGEALGLGVIDADRPWAFSAALRNLLEAGDMTGLRAYVGLSG